MNMSIMYLWNEKECIYDAVGDCIDHKEWFDGDTVHKSKKSFMNTLKQKLAQPWTMLTFITNCGLAQIKPNFECKFTNYWSGEEELEKINVLEYIEANL